MKIKSYLLLIYGVAGLTISLFTAIMTYLIIGEPIGAKMTSQIALTVLATLPIIWMFSYVIGGYLSKKFEHISIRLDAIQEDKFYQDKTIEKITDVNKIYHSINNLSTRLEKSILDLKQNNQNLSTIIKSLAHDIKTPLTIIDGYLDEFEDGMITKEKEPHPIAILKKETAYLNELSQEVITYIQSQEMIYKKEPILLKEFMHAEVCPLLKINDNITLLCEINKDAIVEFNPLALKKILVNLLHNACKYTQKGTITVKENNTDIIIEDTGIGIDQKSHQNIFDPFITLDESRNREKNGFGLGLSISKNLAIGNDYDLLYDTSYNKGSRFILKSTSNNR